MGAIRSASSARTAIAGSLFSCALSYEGQRLGVSGVCRVWREWGWGRGSWGRRLWAAPVRPGAGDVIDGEQRAVEAGDFDVA